MTVDEIKRSRSMRSVVEQYGFKPNRAGYISCPFHKGDKTPSMKIYSDSYNCFACGANGDIFTFVQKMDHCDFKSAYLSLGGTYSTPKPSNFISLYHISKEKEKREKRKFELKKKKELNNELLSLYVEWLKKLEPLSASWCDCMNAMMYCLYVDEYIAHEEETR